MLRLLLPKREDQVERRLVFGLSSENLRRLKAGEFIVTALDELVPGLTVDLWLAAQPQIHGQVKQLATHAQARTGRSQVVLGLDAAAFSKLEAFPRKALSLDVKEPWPLVLLLVRGETEREMLEEWAPLIGHGSEVRIDPRNL